MVGYWHVCDRAEADAGTRRAAARVALTGRDPKSVIDRASQSRLVRWSKVERRRIPDSADILAIYEVLVRSSGDLISYRRIRR
jgi:hypothetical protein